MKVTDRANAVPTLHRRVWLLLILSSLLNGTWEKAQAAVPLPAEAPCCLSLDGPWRFKLEQAPPPPRFLGVSGKPIPIQCPSTFEPFYATDYREDTNWHALSVPGNWEMAGYSPATYHQPDNASGFYRLEFAVPAAWQGRQVKLNFDGVQNGCEIWCNGQPVAVDEPSWGRTNYHESGWTAWQADLTPAIRFGQTNLLALRVTKNTRGVECDTGDFFLLGGVYRSVTLFSVPTVHVADLTIRTKVLPDGQAEVSYLLDLNQPAQGARLAVQLEGQPPLEAEADAKGQLTLVQEVLHPKLWSAEFPNLYALSVELKNAAGQVTERLTRRVGLREISITNGVFCVNHVPVKLVGICRHDVYPTLGTVPSVAVWKKDLHLMKGANFNAIRTSHYPYGAGFYDLCDEMGFYVLGEEPFCWVNCDDAALKPAFEQRVRETVRRDKNHPCVVIWGMGNENKPGPNSTRAAQLTRQLDPTRPRLISSKPGDAAGADAEFDDEHYVTPQQMHKDEHNPRRAQRPMIYSENPNVWDVRNGPDYGSLDLWGAVIQRTWNELWQDEHVTGTFLWEWQDRAVADRCPTKYYTFYPDSGVELLKVKGVVDGFRNPRPEYYHIQMAQSPIVLGPQAQVSADGVVLEITNHYSFTDLAVLQASWRLSRAGRELAQGDSPLKLAPRSHGSVHLPLPSEALASADTLRLDFAHPQGWHVATYQFFLKPIAHPAPVIQALGEVMFPQFKLVTGQVVPHTNGWKYLERATGELVNLKVQRRGEPAMAMDPVILTNIPLTQVETLDADVRVRPGAALVGHLTAALTNGTLSYRLVWSGPKTNIYELGWVFRVPQGVEHFSWDRRAVWSYYPPEHIGRPTGTATPDSAKIALTKVDRPDAFDFNSTKFNCNWAALTDAGGRGLCVKFSSNQRQHVRADLAPDGNVLLVVNRCYSPPRDISSNIVPDLYTELKKNDQVVGTFEILGAR